MYYLSNLLGKNNNIFKGVTLVREDFGCRFHIYVHDSEFIISAVIGRTPDPEIDDLIPIRVDLNNTELNQFVQTRLRDLGIESADEFEVTNAIVRELDRALPFELKDDYIVLSTE